jgi:hypothetical protein
MIIIDNKTNKINNINKKTQKEINEFVSNLKNHFEEEEEE